MSISKINIILTFIISTSSISAGSDNDYVIANGANIGQRVLQHNNQLALLQIRVDQLFELIDSEDAPAIFWGGFAISMSILYVIGRWTGNISD
ncbi:MAG TPA: hypothetical protein VL201_00610 [Patescibacteria group bacterium]|jgi:membrane protein DedA with SNARE-associated domain|nr:hypothetical protein [Patescibacteria group bacterium]